MTTFSIAGDDGIGIRLRHRHRVLRLLDLLAQPLGFGDERGLLVLRRLRDALAVGVLGGAQLFERRDGGPPRAVGGERLVDQVGRLAARLLRALDQLGILTKKHRIDHPSILVGGRCAASRGLSWLHDRRRRPSEAGRARLQPHQGRRPGAAGERRAALGRRRLGRTALLRDDRRRPRPGADPPGARGGCDRRCSSPAATARCARSRRR